MNKLEEIIKILKEKEIHKADYVSKKALLAILYKILNEKYGYTSMSTIYNYYRLLKLTGKITEDPKNDKIIFNFET